MIIEYLFVWILNSRWVLIWFCFWERKTQKPPSSGSKSDHLLSSIHHPSIIQKSTAAIETFCVIKCYTTVVLLTAKMLVTYSKSPTKHWDSFKCSRIDMNISGSWSASLISTKMGLNFLFPTPSRSMAFFGCYLSRRQYTFITCCSAGYRRPWLPKCDWLAAEN